MINVSDGSNSAQVSVCKVHCGRLELEKLYIRPEFKDNLLSFLHDIREMPHHEWLTLLESVETATATANK